MNSNAKLIVKDEVMINLSFENGSTEVNEELLSVVDQALINLGLNTTDDLRALPREAFFDLYSAS